MRIVQVVHSFEPTAGGMESAVYSLSRAQAALGHDVLVITTKEKEKPDEEVIEGVKVKRLWSLHFPFFSSIRFSPGLLGAVMTADAEVIHAHGYATPHSFFAGLGAALKRKPFVFTFHGYHRFKFGISWIFHTAYRLLFAPFFFSWTDEVTTVAEATIPLLKGQVPENKIIVIPNGVDCTIKKVNANPLRKEFTHGDVPLVSYVGRLDKYKGIDVLIRAFARLKNEFPDAVLVIAGQDEGIGKDLKRLAKSLEVQPIFTLLPSERMPDLYSASDIVVLPSYYEGLSLVVLGAIACETPILTTPTGDSERVLKEAYGKIARDFIFQIGNVNELYEKLSNILKNRTRYESTLKKGSKYIHKKYNWSAIAKRTLIVYEKAIEKRKVKG